MVPYAELFKYLLLGTIFVQLSVGMNILLIVRLWVWNVDQIIGAH
ncbi:MAG: hypothetical protein ACLRQF_03850 [Thomasclavelia ramosa]